MIIENSPKVRKLTGHDNIFKIFLIGKLNIQNKKPRITNIHINSMTEFAVVVILIPMAKWLNMYNKIPQITTFTIRFFIIFMCVLASKSRHFISFCLCISSDILENKQILLFFILFSYCKCSILFYCSNKIT